MQQVNFLPPPQSPQISICVRDFTRDILLNKRSLFVAKHIHFFVEHKFQIKLHKTLGELSGNVTSLFIIYPYLHENYSTIVTFTIGRTGYLQFSL